MRTHSHEQLMKTALTRPGVKHEYDILEEEFSIIREMIKARNSNGKTSNNSANDLNMINSAAEHFNK